VGVTSGILLGLFFEAIKPCSVTGEIWIFFVPRKGQVKINFKGVGMFQDLGKSQDMPII